MSTGSESSASLPSFGELPRPDETGLPLAWGLWGQDDQLGTLNRITPETVRAAATEVRRGVRFNLDLPLHLPYSLITEGQMLNRRPPQHTLDKTDYRTLYVRDDKLDHFYLQASTQWDGLTHIGTPQYGFYNGVAERDVHLGPGTRNGIEHVAGFGIATRGVLVDLPRHFADAGRPWEPFSRDVASAGDVQACLEAQRVTPKPGDILLIRTGWLPKFLAEPELEARNRAFASGTFAGLAGDQGMWAFLWDHGIAAVAADNPTLEANPMEKGNNLHLAIYRLGLTIGEFFDLDALAADCAADGRYTCLLTSSPLNLRGGVGSPPNAIAIK